MRDNADRVKITTDHRSTDATPCDSRLTPIATRGMTPRDGQGQGEGIDDAAGASSHVAGAATVAPAPRVLVDLEVDYASEDNYLFAYITDISETGIFVRTTTPEQPGTHLNLRFSPGDGAPPIEVEGEVIWVNPFRPGRPRQPASRAWASGSSRSTTTLRDRLLELVRRFAYLS